MISITPTLVRVNHINKNMKLSNIISEHVIVPKSKQKPKKLKTLPKMKKVYPPFTKGTFKELINVKKNPIIKDPAGGKVL